MKTDSMQIGKVFGVGGEIHYVLPHFQREYSWEKEHWKTLINDVFSVYEHYNEERPPEHFMGVLVVINDGTRGIMPVFRLVDGQQRLTTISLLLNALRLLSQESHPSVAKQISRMLINEDRADTLFYKILPTRKYGDRDSYCAVIDNREIPNTDSRIPAAYDYLCKELRVREFDPNKLFVVLATCLQVVFIDLDRMERPYEIFESLNYKGKSLTQADLVRNYIAMKLPEDKQAAVFENLWSPIEEMLQEKRIVGRAKLGELTAFLRHYMISLSNTLVNKEHIYARFRDRGNAMDVENFIEEIQTLKRFAGYYDCLLRPEKESDEETRKQLERLNTLDVATAYPFLLFMYDRLDKNHINRSQFLAGLEALETYFVRRLLAKEGRGYLNRMFPTLAREIDCKNFEVSIKQALSKRKLPSDAQLRRSAETAQLFTRGGQMGNSLILIFETINRHLSSGSGAYTQLDNEPTIEHIMPQELTDDWKTELGQQWELDYDLLHTLGNLTIVTQSWNSSLSNASYEIKRAKLREHGLRLNSNYFANAPNHWTGEAIRKRAQYLIEKVIKIWPLLGEPVEERRTKPKSLEILGESFDVNSWRDVLERTAEVAIAYCNDFGILVEKTTGLVEYPENNIQSYRQLSNNWWLYVGLSSDSIKERCYNYLESVGIPDEEFNLVEW